MIRARPALAAALALALLLAGCFSVLPKTPPVQLYRFGAGGFEAAMPASGAMMLALGSVTLPRAAAGDGLLTVAGDKAAFVADARWVSPATVLMREAAARALAARSQLRLVAPEMAGATRLDIDVTAFEADYPQPGAAPTVRVALIATLTEPKGEVDTLPVRVSQQASENRLSAITHAYDAAVSDALDRVAAWVQTRSPR